MNDKINKDYDRVAADTSLADIASNNIDINTIAVKNNNGNNPNMFNVIKKTEDNFAKAEAMVDEKPIKTEKTAELERREREDSE